MLTTNPVLIHYYFGRDTELTRPSNSFESSLLSGATRHGLTLHKTQAIQRCDFFHEHTQTVYRLQNAQGYMEFVRDRNSVVVLMFFVNLSEQAKWYPAKRLFKACCAVIFAAGIDCVIGDASTNRLPIRHARDWRTRKGRDGLNKLVRFYERLGLSRVEGKTMVLHASKEGVETNHSR